jgi:NOL1/NOP2/fmu family ribosome biogenesis protein
VRDEWSTQNCNLCTGRQWRIINDIWPSLKEGGHLIYSTCTFNPGENENQVARLLKEHDCTAVNVDISEFPVVIPVPDSGNRLGYGFHPGKVRGEGFFISVVRKESMEAAYKPGRSAGTATIKVKSDLIPIARLYATVGEEYLADFAGTAIALPVSRQEFQMLAGLLGIIKAGTALFTLKQGSVIPAHDLAMSLLLKNDMFPEADVAAEAAIRYLRKEADIGVRFEKTGWILITFNGVKLGFIKNIGQRLNNYYPSEWRIRMESAQSHTVII